MIDTHRDLITGSLEIYLSVISNRLNEVRKVLTVVTAIFASLAVITGIYGMNFQHAYPSFDSPRLRRHAARHERADDGHVLPEAGLALNNTVGSRQ